MDPGWRTLKGNSWELEGQGPCFRLLTLAFSSGWLENNRAFVEIILSSAGKEGGISSRPFCIDEG